MRVGSFKKAAQAPHLTQQTPHLEDHQIPVYDLLIDDLRAWLQRRFPTINFDEEVSSLLEYRLSPCLPGSVLIITADQHKG